MAKKGASQITLKLDDEWMKKKAAGTLPQGEAHHAFCFRHDSSKEEVKKLIVAVTWRNRSGISGHLVTNERVLVTTSADYDDFIGVVDEVQGKKRHRTKAREQAASAPPRMTPRVDSPRPRGVRIG